MVIFGMIVPTGDNYSDLWLSMRFFSGTYDPAGVYYRDCSWGKVFTIFSTSQTIICDYDDDCTSDYSYSYSYYGTDNRIYTWQMANATSYTCEENVNCTVSQLCDIKPTSQPIYGTMTLLPVLLSFVFTAIHWYGTEEPNKRLCTLPLLLAQIWPQYRTGRVLWLYKNGDKRWKKEKLHLEKQLSAVGMYIHICIVNIYKSDG